MTVRSTSKRFADRFRFQIRGTVSPGQKLSSYLHAPFVANDYLVHHAGLSRQSMALVQLLLVIDNPMQGKLIQVAATSAT